MYAIATLLDPISDLAVRQLWTRFEAACGLSGIKCAPVPHFTWASTEALQLEPVEQILREMAGQFRSFSVRASGLGIFTGPKPVVYINLIKDASLLNLHQSLWERLHPYLVSPNGYYHPAHWLPHISLALREPEPGRLGCAVEEIAYQTVDMEIPVDHFAVLYQFDDPGGMNGGPSSGLRSRFDFKEKLVMGGRK